MVDQDDVRADEPDDERAAVTAVLEATVLAAARRRSAALVAKDLDALQTLLHPAFVYANASGQVLGRDEYLELYVRPPGIRWTSQTLLEPRVAISGSTAVVTCLVHDVVRFRESTASSDAGAQEEDVLDETFRTTATWIRTVAGWQCLAAHTSTIPRESA